MLSPIHHPSLEAPDTLLIDPEIVDSKRLQMFYASVRLGSFAAAAQVLSVSPSAISHAMKGLEEDLGCALFRRLGPQVKPTGAAVRLLPMVTELLARMSSIKSEMVALDGRAESLVVRMPNAVAGLLQSGMLATFAECFPSANLEILLHSGDFEDSPDRLADFEISYRQEFPGDRVRRDLMTEKFKAYVAPFHRLGQKSRISITELKQNLLVFPDRFAHQSLVQQIGGGSAGQELKSWILPNPIAARELALHGQGVVFLPDWALGSAEKDGRLMHVKLPGIEISRTCCAWWEACRPPTWVAEVFLSLLATEMDGG